MRLATSPSSAPSAASAAAAWITTPRCCAVPGTLAPTAASSSQRRPHLVKLSTRDGDTCTPAGIGSPAAVSSVSAYQCRGLAPRTPAAASLASCPRRRGPHRARQAAVRGGAAQVGGQCRQRQPAVPGARDTLDLDVVAGQLGQEPGRPILGILGADGSHQQRGPGPRHRDVEQPPLLGEQPRGGRRTPRRPRPDRPRAAGHDVDQLVHAEQRPALAQVGPGAFLHARRRRRGPTPGPWTCARSAP